MIAQSPVLLVVLLMILFIIGYPLFNILCNSFGLNGGFSLSGYAGVFSSAKTYKALGNTLYVAFGVLLLAGVMGTGLAFLVEKTDFRYKGLVRFLAFLEFCVPSYILSVAWIQITSRGGYIHRVLKIFDPNVSYTFSPYSFIAVIIVLSVHLYPLVFFGVSNALRKGGSVFENAARIAGGSPFQVFKSISLPLVMPSLLSTGLLVFSRTMANFGIAAQLALPFGGEVLTTRIYKAISELDIQSLSVLSILLIAISYTLYAAAERWIRRRAFYADDSAHFANPELFKLGRRKWLANLSAIVFFLVVLLIPLLTLLLSSFMKRWGLSVSAGNMTLNNYALVLFENTMMKRAFLNSLLFGAGSAAAAVCMAVIIVYFYRFARSGASAFLLSLASLPLAVPNIILAVGAVFAWINPPLKLYGTPWIIMLTYMVLFIPICIKQIMGLAENVSPAIDRSARTLGVPVLRRIIRLFLPQVLRGAAAGFVLSFLIAFREIPISLLLNSKGNETAGVLLFTIQSNSYGLEMTSTIAVIVILISVTGNLLVGKLCEKRLIHENASVE